MIYDHISHIKQYSAIHPNFEKAMDFLLNRSNYKLEDGKYEIDGDAVFALVQSYPTKTEAEGKWEAHLKYIDIQLMISGDEIMGISPREMMSESQAYNPENDYALFDGAGEFIIVPEDFFTIFFPHDVHMPGLLIEESENIRKIVIKVAV